MRFRAIATDYDGTLATDGVPGAEALAALREAQAAGCKLLLITGREMPDLRQVFPELPLFDLAVAENGGVLYHPATGEERMLCGPPPPELLTDLRRQGTEPLSVGRCIVATLLPHESAVRKAIRELHLNWYVVRNRHSVMLLPEGTDKGSGFQAALQELGLSREQVLGIGDAENDLAFLAMCGHAMAVANAIPAVKQAADQVTRGACGAGVVEAVHYLLADVMDGNQNL
ncbi:MAG TPA: HAD family hydrolase [Candidatus Saccharimonadales bacterium]|nr:HAD family hydrolase [Candidatus Saccharimonadales bacterium]